MTYFLKNRVKKLQEKINIDPVDKYYFYTDEEIKRTYEALKKLGREYPKTKEEIEHYISWNEAFLKNSTANGNQDLWKQCQPKLSKLKERLREF